GKTVSVASILLTPYLTKSEVNGTVEYDGFIRDLLDEIGELTGITFNIETISDGYGRNVSGSWTGLVGDVVNRKVQMAAAPLTISSERHEVVDFSVPFQNFGPVIVMRRPLNPQPSFKERFRRLFQPMSHSVWLMTMIAYFATSVVLYIVCHCNPYEWRHLHRDGQATAREAESFTCMNAFWFVMSTFMWQGYTRGPRSLSGRVVVAFWWMFVVVFLLTYTASLTNILRLGPTPLEDEQYVSIVSLEDLARQTETEFGFLQGGSTESYFQSAQVPYLRHIWTDVGKRKKPAIKRVEDGIRRVRQSSDSRPFAFIMESAMAKYHLRQEPCDLYMTGDLTISGAYSLAWRRGWKQAVDVDRALLQMRENGNLKLLEDKWFQGVCDNNVLDPSWRDRIKVDLGSFSGALIVLVAGLFVGGLITLLEILIFRKAEMGSEDEAAQPMKASANAKTAAKDQAGAAETAADTENVTDV
ncbi:hypothetical protein BaRGS_00025219, partial [Batillaria attramentaria]